MSVIRARRLVWVMNSDVTSGDACTWEPCHSSITYETRYQLVIRGFVFLQHSGEYRPTMSRGITVCPAAKVVLQTGNNVFQDR